MEKLEIGNVRSAEFLEKSGEIDDSSKKDTRFIYLNIRDFSKKE